MPPTPTWEASVYDNGDTGVRILAGFHLMCKINPAFELTQWIQDQNIKLFSTLGATVAPATEGRQSTARHRRQNNDWFEIGANLGRNCNKTRTPRMTEAMQRIAKNPPKIRSRRVSRTSQIGLGTLPEHPWAKKNHIWRNRWPKSRQNWP